MSLDKLDFLTHWYFGVLGAGLQNFIIPRVVDFLVQASLPTIILKQHKVYYRDCMIKSFFLKFPQPLSTLRPLPQPLSPCTLGCLNMFCRFCLCHLIFINDDFLAEMTISPKRRTLLLRVNTGTLNIGLGRAPGTSLHTPAEESSTPPCHTGTQWWESCSLQSPVLYPCPGLVLSMPHCNVKMSVNVALQVVSS